MTGPHVHPDWYKHHVCAMADPTPLELPIVQIIRALGSLTVDFRQDRVLRVGVAHVLLGLRQLLAGNWGNRLDMPTLEQMILVCAEALDYDLDREVFRDREDTR